MIEKPLLTTEHKARRVEWARRWFDILSDPTAPVAFLDEKWFYTTNRRQKLKNCLRMLQKLEIFKLIGFLGFDHGDSLRR